MRTHRLLRVAGGVITAALVLVPITAAAAPQPAGSCSEVLVDTAGQLNGAEAMTVTRAAERLEAATDFEIRVRILTQAEAPSLGTWVEDQRAACPGWQGLYSYTARSNLVVLAFTTDTSVQTGETWLAYGDQLPDRMDDRWDDIQADTINPALRDGDWARGITTGLDEIHTTIDPPPSRAWMWLLGIAVLVALILAIRWWIRRRNNRKRLARQFTEITVKADEQTVALDHAVETLRRDVKLVHASFHADEAATVLGEAPRLLDDADQLIRNRSDLSVARDRVVSGRDLTTVEVTIGSWARISQTASELLPLLHKEEQRLTNALSQAESVAHRVAEVPKLVDTIEAADRAARLDGFVPAGDVAVLDTVAGRTVEIERLRAERRMLRADEHLATLTSDLRAARDALAALRQRRAVLTAELAELDRVQEELKATESNASKVLADLTAAHPPAVTEGMDARLVRGRDLIARAASCLEDARSALSQGDLGSAECAAERVATAHAAATLELTAITGRAEHVATARETAPRRKAALAARLSELVDLTSARVVREHRTMFEELRGQLDALDLKATAPDWLRLDARLRDLDRLATATERAVRHAIAITDDLTKGQQSLRRQVRAAEARATQRSGGGWLVGSSTAGGLSTGSSLRASGGFSGGGGARGSSGGFGGGGARR